MHSSPVVEDEPEIVKPSPHARRESEKENEPRHPVETPGYTTRVLDEQKKVEPVKPRHKVDDAQAKKSAETKKKLLFRRAAK